MPGGGRGKNTVGNFGPRVTLASLPTTSCLGTGLAVGPHISVNPRLQIPTQPTNPPGII